MPLRLFASPQVKEGNPVQTAYRLRLRRMGQLNQLLQMRLFFDDLPGESPVMTGWTETGTLLYQSEPLGAGLSLPNPVTLAISVEGPVSPPPPPPMYIPPLIPAGS